MWKDVQLQPQSTVLQISITFPTELLQKLAIFAAILLVTFILSKVVGSFISKAVGKFSKTLALQFRRFAVWLIWLFGVLVGLEQLGLELTIVLLIITLGGLAVLIALRDTLSNLASKELITGYNPFKIGDWIQIGKHFGRVVDITSMYTVLMTPSNEKVYVPNSEVLKTVVVNKTVPGGTRISVSLRVNRAQDLSNVEKTLLDIGTGLREELVPDSRPEVRVIGIDEDSVRLSLLLHINNPVKGPFIASEVRKKIKSFLDEINVNTRKE